MEDEDVLIFVMSPFPGSHQDKKKMLLVLECKSKTGVPRRRLQWNMSKQAGRTKRDYPERTALGWVSNDGE